MKKFMILFVALVIAATMTVSPAFAEGKTTNDTIAMTVSATVTSGTTINVTWNAVSGASSYDVEVRRNNSVVSQRTGITGTSVSISVNGYGDHVVNVVAKTSTGGIAGSGSTIVNVQVTSTSGGITVTSGASGTCTASWTAVTGVSSYYVSWTTNTGTSSSATTNSTSYTISVEYSTLTTVTVRAESASGAIVGTWTASYSGGATTTGGVTISGTTLYWNNLGYPYYYVTAVCNGRTLLSNQRVTATYYNFSSLLSVASGYPITFAVYSSYMSAIGTATFYSGTAGYGASLNVTLSQNDVTVSWNAVNNVTSYRVTYKSLAEGSATQILDTTATSVVLPRPAEGLYVDVKYINNGTLFAIGSATIDATGVVTYGGANYSTIRLMVAANETSVTATWLRDPYATNYRVTYKGLEEGSTASYFETTVTTAAFSRPAGGFNIEVGFYYNNRYYPIGAATVSESGEVTYSESGHIESCGKDAYVHWTKCDVCGESWGVEEHVLGADGVCEICRYKPEQESTGSGIRGDLNGDGNVTVSDGVTMQRILAGLES